MGSAGISAARIKRVRNNTPEMRLITYHLVNSTGYQLEGGISRYREWVPKKTAVSKYSVMGLWSAIKLILTRARLNILTDIFSDSDLDLEVHSAGNPRVN